MSFEAYGDVYLGTGAPDAVTQRFPTDPKIRREWSPRRIRLPGIGGSATKQDWGRWAGDCRLVLTSEGNFLTHAFKAYLETLLFVRRAEYGYRDYTGLAATVVIADFVPTATFYPDPSGQGQWWEYTLTLDVTEDGIDTLDYAAYTGS